MNGRNYQEMVQRRKSEYGSKFNEGTLAKQFIPFFESGRRIKVQTCGMILTGTVGVTTGWKPAFLLMRTSRSIGSPWILSDKDRILGLKSGRKYLPFQSAA